MITKLQKKLDKDQKEWMADVRKAYAVVKKEKDETAKAMVFASYLNELGYCVCQSTGGCSVSKDTRSASKTKDLAPEHGAELMNLHKSMLPLGGNIGNIVSWSGDKKFFQRLSEKSTTEKAKKSTTEKAKKTASKATPKKATKKAPTKKSATKKATKKAGPVDRADRVDVLTAALKKQKSFTSEQAADILGLEGTFRRQAAVVTLTQLEKAGLLVKTKAKGTITYVVN